MQNQVKDLMTSQPTAVQVDATIDEALTLLIASQAAEVYVVDGDRKLLGVVPDYEVLKARLARISGDEPVEKLMCRSLATVHPESPLDAVTAAFRESCRRSLAVCDAGRLVGQIRRIDVLRSMKSSLPVEAAAAEKLPAVEVDVRPPRFIQPKTLLSSLAAQRDCCAAFHPECVGGQPRSISL